MKNTPGTSGTILFPEGEINTGLRNFRVTRVHKFTSSFTPSFAGLPDFATGLDRPLTKCVQIHTMNSKEVIKRLKADGWKHVRTTGDHHHFRHPEKAGTVTVPHPKKDLPIGTLKSIERQPGLSLR